MPAIIQQMNDLGSAYSHGAAAKLNSVSIQNDIRLLEELYAKIQTKLQYLTQFVDKVEVNEDAYQRSYECSPKVLSCCSHCAMMWIKQKVLFQLIIGRCQRMISCF